MRARPLLVIIALGFAILWVSMESQAQVLPGHGSSSVILARGPFVPYLCPDGRRPQEASHSPPMTANAATSSRRWRRSRLKGLVRLDDKRITVTGEGRPFVRLVAAAFDLYLAAAQARHSVAVQDA